MKSLLKRVRSLWPARIEQTPKQATETALLVFPRCC
ncbi:hypothetical protein RUESEDTHA_01487 [Ruegeria sp. THAF57]|nr:hypothetical protein RUESEDTHA_01487 [Ruegeria sp. THAF57]